MLTWPRNQSILMYMGESLVLEILYILDTNQKKPMVDTQTYLAQIEAKYDK